MSKSAGHIWVRRTGFATGVAVAIALLGAARIPAQPRDLGLDITVVPAPSRQVTVKPATELLAAHGLRPGAEAGGSVEVVNPTSRARRLSVRVLPSAAALDPALVVAVDLEGTTVYRGPLGGLHRPRAARRPILSGDGRTLSVRLWIPEAGARDWQGRIEDLQLAIDWAPEGRR